jgi:cephalosporin hydroxylase
MFPLWDVAIAPVIEASGAKKVVEIGALRGETTVRMLENLGPDSEIYVIDPVPEFDPEEHENAFPGRYLFYRDISHNVLPTLPAMDVALVDGDHNWYTVFHEMRMLSETARAVGAPLPVLILHDVGWPYGRRDLYYAPERIPEEFRQPYKQLGMRPNNKKLVPRGELNPQMNNAVMEGGERNGVMTGLDDFIAGFDKPLRLVYLPVYFGLAIVVEQARLDAHPELVAVLDRLESAEGRADLMRVTEDVRLKAMIFQHQVYFQRDVETERARKRYIDLMKSTLLDEHYLEHEARIIQLTKAMNTGKRPEAQTLRDPIRYDKDVYPQLARQRRGQGGPDEEGESSFLPYTAIGRPRLDHLEQCLDAIRADEVPGDLLDCGTGRGGVAIFFRAYLESYELPDREVWVADRFRSSPDPDPKPRLTRAGVPAFQADLHLVRDAFERFGLLDDRVRLLQGSPDSTLADAPIEQLALLRIGRPLGADIRAVLDRCYDKLAPGGFLVVEAVEDDATGTRRKELDAFRAERNITAPIDRVDASTIVWRKDAGDRPARVPANAVARARARAHAPLPPEAPKDAIDLTVVVVMYNMAREAKRTLQALSRAYQEGVDDVSYEVIVVENGSDEHEKLGAAFVESFGPEFRYVDLGGDATPSPVPALNLGMHLGRGRAFALMIDGAHVVTPGVLRYGLAGLRTYERAIVATQQWYVGPGQQGSAMDDGYDEDYEDRLFDAINWPHAGYRLFEIGHFVGDRDWLDGVWESNCMFVPRELLAQVGGFDEGFTVAGGGYANLELYERLGTAPDVAVATIIGEGSFHQTHGGTTTNQPDAAERRARVFGYSQEYADMRGRLFRGPGKPLYYVGRLTTEAARRSKPRRLSAKMFAEGAAVAETDGPPTAPTPVPEDLASAFTEAVWRSVPWDHTTWLGRRINTAPTDLLAYQEIIATVRPDWIVEVGSVDTGRSLFLATICDLVGHGEVVSVDDREVDDRPEHPRLRPLIGAPDDDAVVAQVRDLVGTGTALVVLGACAKRITTARQFERYAPLVPVGSYVVVADTIVNGHPVWPAFGPGPAEAVKQVLTEHGEFVADPAMTKYSLTFNPGGFLQRVR